MKLSMLFLTIFLILIRKLINISVLGANYYSNGNHADDNLVNWWSNSNGTVTHPANFTNGDVYIIRNSHSRTTTTNQMI
jgi:hypothetical protein